MDGSTFTLALCTYGHMQRRFKWEDNKSCLDRFVAGGVCRLLEGGNKERLQHV